MKTTIKHFEPFIFMPFGIIQEKLFYCNESLKNEYNVLKEIVYKYIENQIVYDNLVKIFKFKNNIIIAHVYPVQYEEEISGREGQLLVVGYIVSRELARKYYEGVVHRIDVFFNQIKRIVMVNYNNISYDIATDFVKMVNDSEQDIDNIIYHLDECVLRCNNNWNNYLWSGVNRIYITDLRKRIKFVKINDEGTSNLQKIYKYIKSTRFKTCTILYDCKNYDYYKTFLKGRVVCLLNV